MRATAAGKYWLAIAAILMSTAATLLAMGRSPICPCGTVRLWWGVVQSDENSQQLSDWYSFSHLIHGFLFYAAGWLILHRRPVLARLTLAVAVEAGWELLENSPLIINRYRAVTMAYGYAGDSILNSLSDIACMMLGFAVARRLPIAATVIIAVALELFCAWAIRDNLTLNVLMLVWPIDAVRHWQAG